MTVAALLLVTLTYAAIAQTDAIGIFAPFAVDIQQAVPVAVSIAVPTEGGEAVTATVPMTVNIALRVSVEGPNVVTVEPLVETEPEITVSEPPPDGQRVDAVGIPYTAEAPSGLEIVQAQSTTRFGDFAVIGEVINVGERTVEYAQATVTVYDSAGNMIAVESDYLDVTTLEPGKSSPFAASFSEDVTGVASFAVRIKSD